MKGAWSQDTWSLTEKEKGYDSNCKGSRWMGLTWGVIWPMVLLFSVMISLVIVGKVH